MPLKKAAKQAEKGLRKYFLANPSPAGMNMILQYAAVGPSPKEPKWVTVCLSMGRWPNDPDDAGYYSKGDAETIQVGLAAMKALIAETGWTLVNEVPAFETEPTSLPDDEILVTWWIHEG
jgi:hypothetical protein